MARCGEKDSRRGAASLWSEARQAMLAIGREGKASGDAALVAKAPGDIARAKGMSQVARDAGLSRESLSKALSGDRTPGCDTIRKVVSALGMRLHAEGVLDRGQSVQ